ncbi:MAG: O-antigen ligase family protein [Burkholderiaceae bacterium]|jgi:O-antigen ligase|nr:O-antigen ligase family protein [Burkholderiaceae bacterium]
MSLPIAPPSQHRQRALIALTVLGGVALALLAGVAAGKLAALDDRTHFALLVALPAAFALGLLFVYARETLLLLIILFRANLDPMLNMTKVGGGGAAIGLGGLLNALIIGLIVMELFNRRRIPVGRLMMQTWLPLLVVMVGTLVITPRLVPGIKNDLALLSNAAIFLLAFVYVRDKVSHDAWMRAVLLSTIGPLLYGYYQIATHQGFYDAQVGMRIDSTFSHPNIFAFYLVLMVSLLFVVWRGGLLPVSTRVRQLLPLYILLLLFLLMATKTRSAWGAMAFFFLAYSLVMERKLLPLLILVGLASLLLPDVRERITELTTGNSGMYYQQLNSFAWRKEMWIAALHFMTPSHYLFGYGKESYAFYSQMFYPLGNGEGPPAHNVYVQVFFDGGVLGLAGFVWLLMGTGVLAAAVRKTDRVEGFLLVMLVLEFALVSVSDNMLDYLVYNWYLWFVLGVGISLHAARLTQRAENPVPSSAAAAHPRPVQRHISGRMS